MKEGIVYIIFGNKTTKEFEVSIRTLRKHCPSVHVTLFTDIKGRSSLIDNEIMIKPVGKRIKQYHLYDSPYDKTLYLDGTSGVVGPIMEVFDLLDRFDIAAVQDIMRKNDRHSKLYSDYDLIPDGFPEYSGGVLLFRKTEAVSNFFSKWIYNYAVWYKLTKEERDQPSLRVSLWQCTDLKLHTLPPEFSIRTKKKHNIIPRIYHYHNMTEESLRKHRDLWKNV